MIRETAREVFKGVRSEKRSPFKINKTTIKPSPATTRTVLTVAPSVRRSCEIQFKEVVIINKVKEGQSFTRVIREGTLFMFRAMENSVEIANNKPWNTNMGKFRQLVPNSGLRPDSA